MKALVTGFEPFGGEPVNPAQEALRLLPARLGEMVLATQVLPTVFGRALDVLTDAVATQRPHIVLSLGLAGGRAALSLERVAINLDDARLPDNAGAQPIDRPVVAGGPPAYFTTLPIKAAAAALREAGLPASVSNTAGTFVCNHVFYGLMHLAATRGRGCAAASSTCPTCRARARGMPIPTARRRRWRWPTWCAASKSCWRSPPRGATTSASRKARSADAAVAAGVLSRPSVTAEVRTWLRSMARTSSSPAAPGRSEPRSSRRCARPARSAT